MMMLFAFPILAVAGMLLLAGSYRRLSFGIGLTVLVFVAAAAAVQPLSFRAGGIHIYVEDLLGGLLLVAAVARLVSRLAIGRQWAGLLPFVAATLTAFVLGAAWHGTKAAGVEYRGFFYLSAAALYCASFPLISPLMKRLVAIWLAGAALLTAIAWFRWCLLLLHPGAGWQWAMVGGRNPWRVLNASQSLYLAQAFLILLYLRRHVRAGRLLVVSEALLAATVLLLQHRSVWVATALAWAAMTLHEGQIRRVARVATVAGILGIVAWWQFPNLLSRANPVVDSLQASIEEPLSSGTSTIAWRVGLWNQYLLEYGALPRWQMLVGTGLGNPGIYRVGYNDVEAAAHNYFVFVLNRVGALGLLALLGGYGMLLWRLRGTGGYWDYAGMLLTLSITQLVYFAVYGPSYDQGILVGAGFGIAAGRIAHVR